MQPAIGSRAMTTWCDRQPDQKLALILFCLLPVMLRYVEHDAVRVLELGFCIYSRKGRQLHKELAPLRFDFFLRGLKIIDHKAKMMQPCPGGTVDHTLRAFREIKQR